MEKDVEMVNTRNISFNEKGTLSLRASRKKKMMGTKKKLQIFCEDSHSSNWALSTTYFLTFVDIFGVLLVGLETMDGPNWDGKHPDFPHLPSLEEYVATDRFLHFIFITELIFRLIISDTLFTRSKRSLREPFFKDSLNWCDLVAILPFVVTEYYIVTGRDVKSVRRDLNAVRILRVFKLVRRFKGADVLVEACRRSAGALLLPIFVLSVFVFISSGILFLLEPCVSIDDDSLCQFTDIFNAAYFCIVTMTTTGFGDQKPQIAITRVLTIIIMISGTLFLAMPLSIVGNNFDVVWGVKEKLKERYEKKASKTIDDVKRNKISINENTRVLQDRHIHLVCQMGHLESYFQTLWISGTLGDYSILQVRKLFDSFKMNFNTFSFQMKEIVEALTESEITSRGIVKLDYNTIKFRNQNKGKINAESYVIDVDNVKMFRKLESLNVGFFRKLKNVLFAGKKNEKLEEFLNVPESSIWAQMFKYFMMGVISLSILVFCLETMPEIQQLGEDSMQCEQVVEIYCQNKGIDDDPGCFVNPKIQLENGDYKRLNFYCEDDDCYGYGDNFGSGNLNCTSSPHPFQLQDTLEITNGFFRIQGGKKNNMDWAICSRPECVNNTPYIDAINLWFPIETFMACCFVLEIVLRVISYGNPLIYLCETMNWFDILSTLPYFLEVSGAKDSKQLIYAFTYSTTDDAFLAVFKFFKIARIFKIMRHYDGIVVISNTFHRCKAKLLVPMFFLFVMIFTFSLLLLPMESGAECIVGEQNCKNSIGDNLDESLSTIAISNNYPNGKRVLIDVDGNEVQIPDAMYSIWLLIATMTTVGYGDIYPITEVGKIFMVGVMLIGIFYMTMPLSIVSAIFNEEYEKANEEQSSPELDSTLIAALSGVTETKKHIRRLELVINKCERIRHNPKGWTKQDEVEYKALAVMPQLEMIKIMSWMMKMARLVQVLEITMKVKSDDDKEKDEEKLEQKFFKARQGKLNKRTTRKL